MKKVNHLKTSKDMNYKEISRNTAIDFSVPIDDFSYKGSYKYDINGTITDLSGNIWKNEKCIGHFSRNGDGLLNMTGIAEDEDFVVQSTNVREVISYIISLVKTETTVAPAAS